MRRDFGAAAGVLPLRGVVLGGDRRGRRDGAVVDAEVLAPVAAHVLDQRHERLTLRGERILDPGRDLGIGVPLDDALLLERPRRSDSVRGLMPASERSSSQKRLRPSARSRMTRIVHLPQMMSAVAQTGQSDRSYERF